MMGLSGKPKDSDLSGDPILLVVDASPLVHAFYSFQQDPDDLAEMFATRLERVRDQLMNQNRCPFKCVVSFDNGRPTFRNWILDEYKSDREGKGGIRECFEACQMMLQNSVQWTSVVAPYGFESDDVLATLADRYQGKVILHTIDKDARQCLVKDRVALLLKSNKHPTDFGQKFEWYSHGFFLQEYGFEPDRFVEYQCLVGDEADNVHGVKGIGDKTAKRLIQENPEPIEEWESTKLGLKSEQLEASFDDMQKYSLPTLRRVFTAVRELDYCPE